MPEPPSSLMITAATPSSPVNVFEASLRGEQNLPAPFPFPSAQHRPRELADEADPPPSGAGHRGRPSFPTDPLGMLVCSPATSSTHLCSFWPPGTPSQARVSEAPPRTAVLSLSRRAHCLAGAHRGFSRELHSADYSWGTSIKSPRAYFINSGAIPRKQLLKSATRGNLKSTSRVAF
jgi:hypothetical protein